MEHQILRIMKTFIHHPFTIYLAASLACLCIMIIVDYMLGSEAEHLNAWAILNKLLGKDTETMVFDSRLRTLSGEAYHGSIEIQQTRPAGWGLALGIGYQYDFKNALSVGFECPPAWGQYPTPSYAFGGTANLADQAVIGLQEKMDKGFKSSVTNMYKVFHLGLAYRFK